MAEVSDMLENSSHCNHAGPPKPRPAIAPIIIAVPPKNTK
jgi:hypothetical protein